MVLDDGESEATKRITKAKAINATYPSLMFLLLVRVVHWHLQNSELMQQIFANIIIRFIELYELDHS